MSGDPTLVLPRPPDAGRPRRGGRRTWLIVLAGIFVLLGLLVVLDRGAVAYADSQAAQQMRSQGFPARPDVSIRGFPFLTQVLGRNLHDVHITAGNIREGPVRLSLVADATDVRLGPGFRSGTITRLSGTGVIGFSSLASAGGIADAPGLSLRAAGPNAIKITANLQVIQASALATITQTGPDTFKVHIASADALPASLLGSFQDFTVHIPALPMGLSIQSVSVSSQGVLIHVTGSNVKFPQNGPG